MLHNLEPFGGAFLFRKTWATVLAVPRTFMEKMCIVVFGTLHQLSLGGCYNSTHKMLGKMLFVSIVSAT